jgi:hypothetical protein
MYSVESYDASDDPEDRFLVDHGRFASAEAALVAARHIVEANLVLSLSAGMSAEDAFQQWRQAGDVPRLVPRGGSAPVEFDPAAFAQERAKQLFKRV